MLVSAGRAAGQAVPAAAARSEATPPREEINPVGQPPPPQATHEPDLFSPPEQLPCPLQSSTLRFTLKTVDIHGAENVPEKALAEAYSDRIGREIPVSGICEIRDRLSLLLFRRGLLARVEIPEQRMADGRLQLEVIEARIVSVRVHGDIGAAHDQVETYLEKLRGLTPFDLDTAQRYLLLANQIPGVHVTADLRPSAQGRGALDLDVQVTRTPIQYALAVQNTGSRELGRWSSVGRVDFNSFTALGEKTSLILYSTLFDNEQQVVEGLEEVRIGGEGLLARGSAAYGWSHPRGNLAPLDLHGDSLVVTGELDYPVIRLKRLGLTTAGGFDAIDQRTDFSTGAPLTDDHLRVFWLRADTDAAHRFTDAVVVNGTGVLEFRQGVNGLGASRIDAPALSHLGARSDAWDLRFSGEGHLLLPMFDVQLRVIAQYADQPLLSYEQLEVGNLTIGQGYDPAALSGDRGVAAEAKVQYGPVQVGPHLQISPYAFYDIADIHVLGLTPEDRTVHSEGVGLVLRLLPYGLRLDVTYAIPDDRTFKFAPTKPPSRVLVQLSFQG